MENENGKWIMKNVEYKEYHVRVINYQPICTDDLLSAHDSQLVCSMFSRETVLSCPETCPFVLKITQTRVRIQSLQDQNLDNWTNTIIAVLCPALLLSFYFNRWMKSCSLLGTVGHQLNQSVSKSLDPLPNTYRELSLLKTFNRVLLTICLIRDLIPVSLFAAYLNHGQKSFYVPIFYILFTSCSLLPRSMVR